MRAALSTVLEILGVLLIAAVLLSIAWQWAAVFIGLVLVALAFLIDRPKPSARSDQ